MTAAGAGRTVVRLLPALLLLAALAPPQPLHAQPGEPIWKTEAIAGRMLARINLYRTREGLAPLRPDPRLDRAAQGHARDMADHDFFGHKGSDGSGIGVRASRAGYAWQRIAENVSAGADNPEEVVDGWMASEGHRRNLLQPDFRDAGIGHVLLDPDPGRVRYRHYWCLMLGAPAGH